MSNGIDKAREHLADAEASIMSHVVKITEAADFELDEDNPDMAMVTVDFPDPLPVLLAVMRSVSRAAGALESLEDT